VYYIFSYQGSAWAPTGELFFGSFLFALYLYYKYTTKIVKGLGKFFLTSHFAGQQDWDARAFSSRGDNKAKKETGCRVWGK